MSLEVMIYLAGVSSAVRDLLLIGGTIVVVSSAFLIAGAYTHLNEEEAVALQKTVKKYFFAGASATLLAALIPNEKTIYSIAAVKISKQVVETKGFNTLYDKTYKLIEKKLDDALTEKEK